jgi:protein TonB
MEPKKNSKADLQKKRGLFLEIGYIIAIGLVLLAFEWTSKPSKAEGFAQQDQSEVVQENVPITRQEQQKEPPPPPPPQSTEVLNIVDNNVEIEDELVLEETEADQSTEVQIDAFAQEEEEEEDDGQVFVVVEDMPSFRGEGLNAFSRYIQKNLVYPLAAQENGIEGTVFIRFIVDKDGSISGVQVIRGVDPSLDQAAVAAVQKAPKWEPGQQRGKPVRVSCTIPIQFSLE